MHDVIVVGAGSSGCAVAARASEDPNRTVLLLEAGPDYGDLSALPFDLANGHTNSVTAHDWKFAHNPTRQREVRFPRGRVTGGSSAVNTAIALRGMPEDFEEWAGLGLTEWGWRDVLPAYKRLERDLDFGERDYHGDAGPIPIRRYPPSEMSEQQLAFIEAARGLGYPDCPDANDPDAPPVIHQQFCEDGTDLKRLVGCYRDVLRFAKTRPISDMVENIDFPRGGNPTDDEIAGLVQRFAGSGYHPCGTAKMGVASDGMAVVDQHGRCHGIDGLAVADASIMPFVPRANTNLTAIMIGEKVGEWLRTRPAIYGL